MYAGHRPGHTDGKGWSGGAECRTPWRRKSATGEPAAHGSCRVEFLVDKSVSKQDLDG